MASSATTYCLINSRNVWLTCCVAALTSLINLVPLRLSTSTNHIAAALGIGPGNLYYHYRNKEEIIRAIFERLFDVWDTTFTLSGDRPPTLDDLQRLVRDNFAVMWDYRFLY